jgi:hypothetical protein
VGPRFPANSRKEIKKYRRARDELLGEVAERMGGKVMVVEFTP